jgi:hypothetical protein
MLHCNMIASTPLQLFLDDLLADLRHARRRGDLGRLALIAYCDVRRWARQAGETAIADLAAAMVTAEPHASRAEFLGKVERLIVELEQAQSALVAPDKQATVPRIDRLPGARSQHGEMPLR